MVWPAKKNNKVTEQQTIIKNLREHLSYISGSLALIKNKIEVADHNNYLRELIKLIDFLIDAERTGHNIPDYFFYRTMAFLVCLYQNYHDFLEKNHDTGNCLNAHEFIKKQLLIIQEQIKLFAEQIKALPDVTLLDLDVPKAIYELRTPNSAIIMFHELPKKHTSCAVPKCYDVVHGAQQMNTETKYMQIIFQHMINNRDFNMEIDSQHQKLEITLFPGTTDQVSYSFTTKELLNIQWHNIIINEIDLQLYVKKLEIQHYRARFFNGEPFDCHNSEDLNKLQNSCDKFIKTCRDIPEQHKKAYMDLKLGFKLAINRYTDDSVYTPINYFLRGDIALIRDPQDFKSVILDIVLAIKGLEQLPKFDGIACRGETNEGLSFKKYVLPQITESSMQGAFPVKYPAFTSSAADAIPPGFSSDVMQVFFTDGRAGGVLISPFSRYPSEGEVLFPPGTQFQPNFLAIQDGKVLTMHEAIAPYVDVIKHLGKEIVAVNIGYNPTKTKIINKHIEQLKSKKSATQ